MDMLDTVLNQKYFLHKEVPNTKNTYLAKNIYTNQQVLITILPSYSKENSHSESKTSPLQLLTQHEYRGIEKTLEYQTNVTVFDQQYDYLVSPYHDCTTLYSYLQQTTLSYEETLELLYQVGTILSDLFQRVGVHHLALDLNQITFDHSPLNTPKIRGVALGLFHEYQRVSPHTPHLTQVIEATDFSFISPELASDLDQNRVSTPIYQLGIIGYSCLKGRSPYADIKNISTYMWTLTQKPLPPLNLSINPEIELILFNLLKKMTNKNPALRGDWPTILHEINQTKETLRLKKQGSIQKVPSLSLGPTPGIERYHLLNKLGQGGFGVVFKAIDQRVKERTVAVKILNLNIKANQRVGELFNREAKVMSKLSHANTLTLLDYGPDFGGDYVGCPFMVFEFLNGQDLGVYLDRKTHPLDEKETLTIISAVAESLHEAHMLKVIHRDIKPDNIFIHQETGHLRNQIKLFDFGIAKIREDADMTIHGRTQGILGTPHYMSPEQLNQSNNVTHLTDMYSLGIVAYQCLTKQLPFTGDSLYSILQQHNEVPIPLDTLHKHNVRADIIRLIQDMTEKDQATRIQSMQELVAKIDLLLVAFTGELAGISTETNELNVVTHLDQKSKKRPRILFLLMLFIIVFIGVGGYILQNKTDSPKKEEKEICCIPDPHPHPLPYLTEEEIVKEAKVAYLKILKYYNQGKSSYFDSFEYPLLCFWENSKMQIRTRQDMKKGRGGLQFKNPVQVFANIKLRGDYVTRTRVNVWETHDFYSRSKHKWVNNSKRLIALKKVNHTWKVIAETNHVSYSKCFPYSY